MRTFSVNLATFLLLFTLSISVGYSQTKDSLDVDRIDAYDVVNKILKKPASIDKETEVFKRSLTVVPGFGYSQLKGIALVLEGNYSFKTSEDAKVSVLVFVPEVTLKKYLVPRITSSVWLDHNRFNLNTDWRYYKYIGIDFGLGSGTESSTFNQYKFDYYRFHQTFSKAVLPDFLLGVGYNLDIHNHIAKLGEVLKTNSSAMNLEQNTVSSGIIFNVLYDNRRNKNFPLGKESYASFSISQNLKFLKSTSNYKSVIGDFRKYFSNTQKPLNVFALRSFNWFTLGQAIPYFDLPAAVNDPYNSISRPFIEGRFRGKNLIYFEAEYRFNLTKNELLGGAIFFNSSSFSEQNSNKFKKISNGFGASARIMVNKKSKVYLVASYGIGSKGSKGLSFSLGDLF